MIRRKAPKSIGGRKAGEDHARSQCPLRGEAFVGSTLSLAAISGFTVFKRTAALPAFNGSSFLSAQLIFWARSRAGASRDD
ncbi:hypothetical protein V512_004685 [Mesotoga sp. Brook.08.105.5.1]|nr:hypothetical protein RM69_04045 [Mesotoga sp. SC_NapDC3]PVD16230.1 hypothetical protein V512_004685 [Mesotoga sp. Brook.08.105.5.1]